MGSRCEKKRMNEGDRLSSLPDDIIHKILSYVSTKHAVETSVLSSRWRCIWTSMPCLNISSKDFRTPTKYLSFIKNVLCRRNNQVEVASVKLTFHGWVSQAFVEKNLNYMLSHNVGQLNVTCLPGEINVSLSYLSSRSLKHLTLTGFTFMLSIKTLSTWELPALATLNLHRVTLYEHNTNKCAGLFSNFASLKILTLNKCRMAGGLSRFNISSLTLKDVEGGGNVVTPQLKNCTVNHLREKHLISAPDLSSLHYEGCYFRSNNVYDAGYDDHYRLQLSNDLLHLEKVDVCNQYSNEDKACTHEMVCLLQYLHSVKFLTLNFELVQLLCSFLELISHEPSPFANLKSLKIHPNYVYLEDERQPKLTVSPEVERFLLDSSPRATFTMVSHEDIKAVKNVASARNLMRELQVLLEQWKEDSEANAAHKLSHLATVHEQMEGLNERLQRGYIYTGRTISMLRKIEEILAKLPAFHRDQLRARCYGFCTEAEAIIDNMVDFFKTRCDKKPRL